MNFEINPEATAGHYARAEATATQQRTGDGECTMETSYTAEAGPIGTDLGGHYEAEGWGWHLNHEIREENYPDTAHVEDAAQGTVSDGTTVRAHAYAEADSPLADFVSDDADDSNTCDTSSLI